MLFHPVHQSYNRLLIYLYNAAGQREGEANSIFFHQAVCDEKLAPCLHSGLDSPQNLCATWIESARNCVEEKRPFIRVSDPGLQERAGDFSGATSTIDRRNAWNLSTNLRFIYLSTFLRRKCGTRRITDWPGIGPSEDQVECLCFSAAEVVSSEAAPLGS